MNQERISRVRGFSKEYDYNDFSIIRLESNCVNKLGKRGQWMKISSGKRCIYRRLKGIGGESGFSQDCAELDYDSRNDLGISGPKDENAFYACDLLIRSATWLEVLKAHLFHPNPDHRVAYQIAFIGLLIGILSLFHR